MGTHTVLTDAMRAELAALKLKGPTPAWKFWRDLGGKWGIHPGTLRCAFLRIPTPETHRLDRHVKDSTVCGVPTAMGARVVDGEPTCSWCRSGG